MVRCRTCNNLTAEDLPASNTPTSYHPSCEKIFQVEKEAGEFEDSAAMGCATCDLILQAIRHYIDTPGSGLSLSDPLLDKILLEGDCNEPLRVSFSSPKKLLTTLELFEERHHFKGDYASLYPAVGFGSTPTEVLDVDFAARLASQWITRCVNEHRCVEDDVPLLPSRVLDITSDSVKLVTPAPSTPGRYAALSYCWGSAGNLTTTLDNINERRAGIVWDDLPNLIQDVIQIIRRLGIGYLWVDALCIIQNDSADWRAESSKMGDTYGSAYLTIAADAAKDTSRRLTSPRNSTLRSTRHRHIAPLEESAGTRKNKRIEVPPPLVVDGLTRSLCVREPWWHSDMVEHSTVYDMTFPLIMRGWALQERLFSSRVLHFAAYEMIWECKASLNCECEGVSQEHACWGDGHESPKVSFETAKAMISKNRTMKPLPSWAAPSRVMQDPDFGSVWTRLVSAYSARRLTFERDRLPAISSLARYFSLGRTYLAGLWADDLPWHLAWCVEDVDEWSPRSTNEYSGPTWSWASTIEEVSWPSWRDQAKSRVQILEASTAPMSFNEYGEVSWGRIRLRACVAVAKKASRRHRTPGLVNPRGDFFSIHSDVGKGQKKSGSNQRTVYNLEANEDLWCLLLLDDVDPYAFGTECRTYWVMVAAKPNDQSIRRARLDPDAHKDIIICERIGYLRNLEMSREKRKATKWITGANFKQKEVILI
ncbi:hypothetical protein J7T55_001547 [Diaporthe amygdali]|uniref:uncharacterized protein n=1 Tax=Phomopsis amygdali TaxID=1214568 RepID=UPI0022FE37A9|nr:uncharacterized protein J7T55_001547 [Diaporthe amygdali]KAJ0115138.1 hypothetical protein J7T55_001547 [Diaporthe amygdali]